MIYLAVLLVLTGLFIILMVVFSESVKQRRSEAASVDEEMNTGPMRSDKADPEDVEILLPERKEISKTLIDEEIFPEFDVLEDHHEKNIEEQLSDWDYDSPDEFIYNDSDDLQELRSLDSLEIDEIRLQPLEIPVCGTDHSSVEAVLFDDRSNIVDYNTGEALSGLSVEGYKNIKRIGKGTLHLDDDGLSFYLDEKLYRIDFHRIYDVWSGANFIALPLRGSSAVKLFIVDRISGFPDRVEVYFQEYVKGI